jgi:hypothetical protein
MSIWDILLVSNSRNDFAEVVYMGLSYVYVLEKEEIFQIFMN